jgi:hypothetical protein
VLSVDVQESVVTGKGDIRKVCFDHTALETFMHWNSGWIAGCHFMSVTCFCAVMPLLSADLQPCMCWCSVGATRLPYP